MAISTLSDDALLRVARATVRLEREGVEDAEEVARAMESRGRLARDGTEVELPEVYRDGLGEGRGDEA